MKPTIPLSIQFQIDYFLIYLSYYIVDKVPTNLKKKNIHWFLNMNQFSCKNIVTINIL